jgi:hypothetical protein
MLRLSKLGIGNGQLLWRLTAGCQVPGVGRTVYILRLRAHVMSLCRRVQQWPLRGG